MVSLIQETISHYVNNGSHVVMCMLDASQTFDRVNLLTLFKKLRDRNMCPVYLKTLIQMYRTQSLRINWNGYISPEFNVNNGVKQGAVLN